MARRHVARRSQLESCSLTRLFILYAKNAIAHHVKVLVPSKLPSISPERLLRLLLESEMLNKCLSDSPTHPPRAD